MNSPADWTRALSSESSTSSGPVSAGVDAATVRPSGKPQPHWVDGPLTARRPSRSPRIEFRPAVPPQGPSPADDAVAWATEHRAALLDLVTKRGSVHVRGLPMRQRRDAATFMRALTTGCADGCEATGAQGAQPSDRRSSSSSSRPSLLPTGIHHEGSHRLECPGLMLFARLAGQTDDRTIALADAATMLEALPVDLVNRFEREGWLLVRNYTEELGPSIAEAFGTEDRSAIELYCCLNAIEFEWQRGGGLRTTQRRSAVVVHPTTGRRCWFNQIAFFNEWTMNAQVRDLLVGLYGAEGLPFNTYFGGGERITKDIVREINDAYDRITTHQRLGPGELIAIDNIGMAHSRGAVGGVHDMVVTVGAPVRVADLSARIEIFPS